MEKAGLHNFAGRLFDFLSVLRCVPGVTLPQEKDCRVSPSRQSTFISNFVNT